MKSIESLLGKKKFSKKNKTKKVFSKSNKKLMI